MEQIINYIKISDEVATSGQPRADQFVQIQQAGFAHVINLAMPDSDNAVPEEDSIVTTLGMNYFHIPVPWQAPQQNHLFTFIRLMQAVEQQKVWIHCALNMRVSAFMYQYLTQIKGVDSHSAKSPILLEWEPAMDDVWREFLNLRVD